MTIAIEQVEATILDARKNRPQQVVDACREYGWNDQDMQDADWLMNGPLSDDQAIQFFWERDTIVRDFLYERSLDEAGLIALYLNRTLSAKEALRRSIADLEAELAKQKAELIQLEEEAAALR